MAGHNKWSSIKHKKGAVDAQRGKLFSRLSKEITLAAREGGGDMDKNPRLRTAVSTAKSSNMPNDNIDRAIKKGTGELSSGDLEELTYEGYGPAGVAILVTCLSDNRNRTAANIRTIFSKNGSKLADNGSVSPLFQRKARFVVETGNYDEHSLLELLLESDTDVQDLSVSDGQAEITASPEAFADIAQCLEHASINIHQSGLVMQPYNLVDINDSTTAQKIQRVQNALEEEDDVQEVYTNARISEDVYVEEAVS